MILLATATAAAAVLTLATYAGCCGLLAQRFTRAERRRPLAGAGAADAGAEAVQFAARDGRARISAWYLGLPAASARGAVVFVHGKDACRGDELKAPTFELAERFRERGFAVLMIDLRGHGASSPARLTYGGRERHDVQGAVDWLLERGYPATRIGILGGSMDAGCALLAAADATPVAALVLDSPYADFDAMIDRQFRRLSRGLPRALLPGALAIARCWTGVDLCRVNPLAAARALRGTPMLVVHSAGDRLVPMADAQAIARAGGGELWTTDSHGHLGSYAHAAEEYERRVLAFFATWLAARREAAEPSRASMPAGAQAGRTRSGVAAAQPQA